VESCEAMPGPVVVAVGSMTGKDAASGNTNVGCATRIHGIIGCHAWPCGSGCGIDGLHGCSKWRHKRGLC
jgi:hypothetical protein